MTNETLQQKIDANFRRLCEFHFDGYQAELDTWAETNEALQEFREQIEAIDSGVGGTAKKPNYILKSQVLALLGTKDNL